MNRQKSWHGSVMLLVTAMIWGVAFVAQSEGMNHVGTFTFNACRFVIGGVVLVPFMVFMRKKGNDPKPPGQKEKQSTRTGIKGGICCGVCLFLASTLQQSGIAHTTVGKAGFITSLYIIIVPLLGLFVRKKVGKNIWISVPIAAAGMYLMCIDDSFVIGRGDLLVFLCAIAFSLHILVIDYFSPRADGVLISCVQFFTAGAISTVMMIISERPEWSGIMAAALPILYAGVLSCGVGYTLQVIAQKRVEPVVATLLMSLESVFSLIAGVILLSQVPSRRAVFGCALVFAAIILAQIPPEWIAGIVPSVRARKP